MGGSKFVKNEFFQKKKRKKNFNFFDPSPHDANQSSSFTLEVVADFISDATKNFGQKSVKIGTEVFFNVMEFDYDIKANTGLPESYKSVATQITYGCGVEKNIFDFNEKMKYTNIFLTALSHVNMNVMSNALSTPWLLLAILLALLIIGIIMFILFKCGFFKRSNKSYNQVRMHTATRGTIGADHAKQSPKYFDRQNQQIDRKEYSEPNASSSLLQ